MLAIFLDESGIFETEKEHAQLNAGLVYKGENLQQAVEKLQILLEQICFQHRLTGSKSSVRKKVQRFIGRFTFEYR